VLGEEQGRVPIRLKVLCAIAIGIPFAVAGLFLWFKAVESRRWESMSRELERLAQTARSRDPRRPVLRGSPQPGNAWSDYEALFLAKPRPSVLRPAGEFLYQSHPPDRQKVEDLLKGYEYFLEALQRATQKSEAQRIVEWERGVPSLHNVGALGDYAVYQARRLRESGRVREAAELLLDAGQYGGDVGRNTCFVQVAMGAQVTARCLDELKDLVLSGACSQDDLRELSRELEILDQNLPKIGDAYVNTAMAWGFLFLKLEKAEALEFLTGDEIKAIKAIRWRYGDSDRLLLVDAFQKILSAARRLGEGAAGAWKEDRDVQSSVVRELETDTNPLVRSLRGGLAYVPPGDSTRECLVRLRLLRMAVRFKVSGEVQKLGDPFGDTLLSSQNGRRLKVWSVGRDGVDDGGLGEWSTKKGKDIVLEVGR
jgi:hypothetical protein